MIRLRTVRTPFEEPHIIDKEVFGFSYQLDALQNRWETTVFSKLFLARVEGVTENVFDDNEATRFNDFKNTSDDWGYGIASGFDFLHNVTVKGSFERTFRIPEGFEIFGDGLLLESNPLLKPEQSDNINLGFLWQHADKGFDMNLDANAFYRHTKNLFFLLPTGVTARYINLFETNNIGIEGAVSATYHTNLFTSLSATYQYVKDAVLDIRIANLPYLFGNFTVGYVFNKILFAKGQLIASWESSFTEKFPFQSFVDGNTGDRLLVPQQIAHNFQLNYAFDDRYHIALLARNITNQRVYDNLAVEKPGRAVFVKIRYFLK